MIGNVVSMEGLKDMAGPIRDLTKTSLPSDVSPTVYRLVKI